MEENYLGLQVLDHQIVEKLTNYLYEREQRLALQLSLLTKPVIHEPGLPELPRFEISLTAVTEEFAKAMRIPGAAFSFSKEQQDQIASTANLSLWEFTELLEGAVVELFQQLKQIPLEQWNPGLLDAVFAIKELLLHKIEDLRWVLQRLQPALEQLLHPKSSGAFFRKWIALSDPVVDPAISKNLEKTDKVLKERYQQFNQRYDEYMHLKKQIEETPIRSIPLSSDDMRFYENIQQHLLMLGHISGKKSALEEDLVRSLRTLGGVDEVYALFQACLKKAQVIFYTHCHKIKEFDSGDPLFTSKLEEVSEELKSEQQDLKQLIQTIGSYRSVLLKHDPNPYVRSRLGFTEWTVGPEPEKALQFRQVVFDAETLNEQVSGLISSLKENPVEQAQKVEQAKAKCLDLLHEMAQPLISRERLQDRAQLLLGQIAECNEPGCFQMGMISFVEDVLNRAMRTDWRYHVLHQLPLFQQLYETHLGLSPTYENPSHAFRLDHFQKLFRQIETWVLKSESEAHLHEISLDINDMKIYLQDFLAVVQRCSKEKSNDPFLDETAGRLSRQLLEYRYIFGKFLSKVASKLEEQLYLRQPFFFVEQYFESADRLLHELKQSWEGEHSSSV